MAADAKDGCNQGFQLMHEEYLMVPTEFAP